MEESISSTASHANLASFEVGPNFFDAAIASWIRLDVSGRTAAPSWEPLEKTRDGDQAGLVKAVADKEKSDSFNIKSFIVHVTFS